MIETEIEARKRFDERVQHYEMGHFTIIEKTFIYSKTNPDVGEKFGHIKVISGAKKVIDEEFFILDKEQEILKAKWTKRVCTDLGDCRNLDAEVELTSILSEQVTKEIEEEKAKKRIVKGYDTKIFITPESIANSIPRMFKNIKTSDIVDVQPLLDFDVKKTFSGRIDWNLPYIDTEASWNPNEFIWSTRYSKVSQCIENNQKALGERFADAYDREVLKDLLDSYPISQKYLTPQKTYAHYAPYIPLHIDDKPHDVINVKNAKKLGY